MGLSFFRDTITVLRAQLSVKNGSQIRDWEHATQTIINNVQVTAGGTSQDFAGRTLSIEDSRTLRANYDADIQEGDRIIYNGITYEIDGEIFHTKSPAGRASSTRCRLRRWIG